MSERIELNKLLDQLTIKSSKSEKIEMVIEGQYKEAYNDLQTAYNSGIPTALIGPVGSGKTLLARYFAAELNKKFEWITFTDVIRPHTLIGYFDPIKVLKKGFTKESFTFGPLLKMVLNGGVFLANEVNRADEYILNVFLDILEEKSLEIPQLDRRVSVSRDFFFIAAMNSSEFKGTRKLSEAFRSRIGVWIELGYPQRDIELKIIQTNVPEEKINENYLNMIIELIQTMRKDR